MRLSLFMLGICVGIVGVGTRVEAQNYPWCALYSKGDGADLSCGFISFEQCMASVRGIGGFCIQNNTYQAPPGPHPSVQRRRSTQRP
jgi:Protein of unknown function (DUF3551)